ncbi:DUF3095 domain-containing protein [Pukyongiella litopenaei]|uniref:DUF3095 domain-containing protein n=1 Tax=Pukyongiella litopenaei TaxID=2605946 RepID=A0A2S0MNC2_9RHOB|nr:DUF3095 domain-containing protein [Pukyongiella litopenaei]AVO37241.1 DUF3095 domain-containing protein [Pukyongiella litopenaei]
MDAAPDTSGFYENLPLQDRFAVLADPGAYAPLPDDWHLGVADVENSTGAVADGRYKTVNMVGGAVISAQINGMRERIFPFVFGGDGAGFACAPGQIARAGRALAAVRCWAREEFSLTLRVALVPVRDIRAAGHDVAVARYRVSPGAEYAMFSGGGLSWAEGQMKQGLYALPEAAPGTVPDLTGLSCRWSDMAARNGTILSLVVLPEGRAGPAFARLAARILGIADRLDRGGHPVPAQGPRNRWPNPGNRLEAHASRAGRSLMRRRLSLLGRTLPAWFLFRSGIRLGRFDPRHYAAMTGANADYRKFDDGLKMTLDSDRATVSALRDLLDRARADGVARYGMCEQDAAMMTCIVPSPLRDDHVHFIDGAAGGYTAAAAALKRG